MPASHATTATLSTGRTVALPLRCRCDVHGALLTARWHHLREAVPEAVTPVRLGPKTGAVALVGIGYREVDTLDPYDEFGVVVPVVRRTASGVPFPGADVGGHVVALAVTTEESRALGEVWGFPKEVAEVRVDRNGPRQRTRVTVDGQWAVTLETERVGGRPRTRRIASYSTKAGRLLRTAVDLGGDVGTGVGLDRVTVRLGGGELGNRLRGLGLGTALVRFAGNGVRAMIHEGEPVE